ncbi:MULTISPECIES: hypothetical protein [Photorhabdus]|uniref:Uncharacterized protein n=1 Tax=Photorhabdus bodei TaxID=2029681 RepID=A0AAW6BIF9_9GAMM|nr:MULTISPECIES: hypothetical protein [Photorhabdus]MDB6368439.1 hypothetical protein [Photorhabdus bodei]MDB6372541.1 hypothetical protein [Photorhabdus bodei]
MTGVRECSQQRGNLKDDGYKFGDSLSMLSRCGYSYSLLSVSF